MSKEEFECLPEIEQVCALLERGRLVDGHMEGSDRVFVYCIESFYVRTRYQGEQDNLCEVTCLDTEFQPGAQGNIAKFSTHPAERIYHGHEPG